MALYNATKFALMNGAQVPADGELPDAADLTVADRWILGRLDEVLAEVDAGFDSYEFSKACEALYHFAWDEVCDWYLELAKVQFAQDDPQRSRSTALVLGAVLDPLLRALSPVMPFVTEVLWKALTGGESVVIASWPTRSGRPADAAAATEVDDLQRLITEVRRFRSDQGLRPGQRVAAEIDGLDAAGLSDVRPYLDSLARLDGAGDDFSATATVDVRLSSATVTVRIDTSGTVDIEAERKRAAKDLAAAEKELAQTTAKLGNEQFLAKAPDNVVAKIRERQQVATEEVERLGAKLASLGGS